MLGSSRRTHGKAGYPDATLPLYPATLPIVGQASRCALALANKQFYRINCTDPVSVQGSQAQAALVSVNKEGERL
jgi:hypothetical protein